MIIFIITIKIRVCSQSQWLFSDFLKINLESKQTVQKDFVIYVIYVIDVASTVIN